MLAKRFGKTTRLSEKLTCFHGRRSSFVFEQEGQSTVEFAIVFAGFISMVLALGILWRFVSDANVVNHAVQSASHAVTGVYSQVVCDVFLY